MNNALKLGFCISGQGRLFRAAAQQASALGIQPSLVVVEGKAAADLDAYCHERGIRFHRLANKSRSALDEELFKVCTEAHLDLLVLTFDKILPPPLVQHYSGRIINIHPALLPASKGMRAMEQTVNSGARFGGATIHEVDEEIDHGPIIAQCALSLHRTETAESLGQLLFPLMRQMYLQVISWYAERRVNKDSKGRVWVRDAVYGELPFSPKIERTFPD